ncbi:MAG TPA: hypothetical protein VM368_06275 [Flavisolibacter sp.]|nr:hypothetical protein [Flavisolibacter sp.]
MMKLIYILAIAIMIGCNAEKKEDAPVEKTSAVFYYYPKTNVYFDTSKKVFHFFDSSTNKWESGDLPAALYADLGKASTIVNPAQPVWVDNKNHRLIYSAALYADSTDFKKKTTTVSAQPKKRVDTTTIEPEKKKETKVGKFIRKVFGKKKQAEEN